MLKHADVGSSHPDQSLNNALRTKNRTLAETRDVVTVEAILAYRTWNPNAESIHAATNTHGWATRPTQNANCSTIDGYLSPTVAAIRLPL